MDVALLGTGAADGWPNPFCRCGSCIDAVRRGELRGQTAALVDDVMLIDCGPEAPGAAVRHGRTLAGVRHLLVTHAHPDHLGPQVLLSRAWVVEPDKYGAPARGEPPDDPGSTDNPSGDGTPAALEVIGPADALDQCRPWVAPDSDVRFRPVTAGDRIAVGDYDVRVLPAQHRVFREGDAVLYDVTGPDSARVLWACDTGPWPHEWFAAVADARFHAVFLEETLGEREELSEWHLGLDRFARVLRSLRSVGAITEHTDVVAVHLGHHNPPIAELQERLRLLGARPGHDGEVVGARPAGDPDGKVRDCPSR